jgi:hypothetical protein
VVLAVAAALGSAGPAAASPECPNAENLIDNCGFETDDSGWDFTTGDTFTRSGLETHTGLFSLEIDAEVFKAGSGALIETCLEGLDPDTPYALGGWFKLDGLDLSGVSCLISIRVTAAGGFPCGGSYVGEVNSGSLDFSDGDWQEGRVEIYSGAAVDAEFGYFCGNESGPVDFLLYLDDLYLIFDTTVFADGFEDRDGDTCNWDASVGGGC